MKGIRKFTTNLLFASLTLAVAFTVGYAQQKGGDQPRPEHSLEERVIRLSYAKLMLFSKAARLRKAEDELAARRPENDLRFEIRNVKTGPIEEIDNRLWEDMVTGRFGEVLSVVPGETSHNQGPKHAYYLADWVDVGYANLGSPSETVSDVLGREPERSDVSKYTSYEVTVHYEGKTRPYRAMVIYHQPPQSVGKTKIEFMDNVVGSFALGEALAEQNPPMRFPWNRYVRSQAYERSGPAGRFLDTQPGGREDQDNDFREPRSSFADGGVIPGSELGDIDDGQREWKYTVGGWCDSWPGTCCDWHSMICCYPFNPNVPICDEITCGYPNCSPSPIGGGGGGGGGEESGCSADSARGEIVEKSFEDFSQHVFAGFISRHSGWAKFRPKCVVDTSCSATCYVNHYGSPSYGSYDDGPGTTSDGRYHAVRIKTSDNSGGTAARGQTVDCSAAVAMAFKSCTDQNCGFQVSLTLGPGGWQATSEGFFEAVMQHSWQCQAPR
jgi:hypothetical protein